MAANSSSDGRDDNEAFIQHENASETLSEGGGQDKRVWWMPKSGTLLEPVLTPGTTWTPTMITVPTTMVRPSEAFLLHDYTDGL